MLSQADETALPNTAKHAKVSASGMSYKGRVKNGVVVLPRNAKLANGTEVEVTPVSKPQADDFTDMLVKVAKKVRGLPRDLAAQHDHYLYGTPKR